MNIAKEHVVGLVAMELQYAKENHEDFHSLHESYAVLLEEVEEAREELERVERKLNVLWQSVREDDCDAALRQINEIEEAAVCLASEAIQVAAMAQKVRGFLLSAHSEG